MSDLKLRVTSWGEVRLDKRELTKLMRSAGNDIKTKTARLINRSDGGGRQYGSHRASSPGDPPTRVSGELRSSLKTYVYRSGEGFAVRARQFYSLFLEAGARGGGNPFGGRSGAAKKWREGTKRRRAKGKYRSRVLEPRPFLDRVMQQQASELERRTRLAMNESLTWKQTK